MRTSVHTKIDQEKVINMVEKIVKEGKTVYIYSEAEHQKAIEYENISHKAIKLLNALGGK